MRACRAHAFLQLVLYRPQFPYLYTGSAEKRLLLGTAENTVGDIVLTQLGSVVRAQLMLVMRSQVVLVSILLEEWNRSEVKFIKILKNPVQKSFPKGPMRSIKVEFKEAGVGVGKRSCEWRQNPPSDW